MKDRIFGICLPLLVILAAVFPANACGYDVAIPPLAVAGIIAGGSALAGGLLGRRKKLDSPTNPALLRTMEQNLFNDLSKYRSQGGFFSEGERSQLRARDLEDVAGFFRPTEQNAADMVNAQNLTGTSAASALFRDVSRQRRGAQADVGGALTRQQLQERLALIDQMNRFLGRTPAALAASVNEQERRPKNVALAANLFGSVFSNLAPGRAGAGGTA